MKYFVESKIVFMGSVTVLQMSATMRIKVYHFIESIPKLLVRISQESCEKFMTDFS
jgi:hypothetical protein